MKKRVADKYWFPWWPDKWIFGSVRIECTPAERGIWVDLLSLASKDDGHIRANEETAYPIKQLSGMLIIEEKELSDAINKFIKTKKLTRLKSGTLYITKWEKYQFSERHKRRVNGGMSAEADAMSEKKDAIIKKNILKDNKIKDNKIKNIKKKIEFSVEQQALLNITKEDMEIWEKAYPACDIMTELHRMADWLLSNPDKRKKNYRRFITNWLSRTQEKGGTRPSRAGKDRKDIDDWVKDKGKKEKS